MAVNAPLNRKLRMGLVGGGQGAFIGRVHSIAACLDNRDCAPGDVCMGQVGWNLPGGMCTHVCSGLAEATPCGPNDACQDFAGVGLCFARCQNGACPGRPSAICTALDPSWIDPGCVPQ